MKGTDFLAEIRGLTIEDLQEKRRALGEELMKLRFRHATQQLTQTHQFGELKKNIARVTTVLNAKLAESSAGVSAAS